MKTFLKLLVLVPIAAIAVAFAVANRQVVTVSFDPFSTEAPAYSLSGPLFVLLLIVIVAGVVIGGVASWLGQGRHRRGRRAVRRENEALRDEVARLRADLAAQTVQPAGPTVRGDGVLYPALPARQAA